MSRFLVFLFASCALLQKQDITTLSGYLQHIQACGETCRNSDPRYKFKEMYEHFYGDLKNVESEKHKFESFSKDEMQIFLQDFNKAKPSLYEVISEKNSKRWFLGLLGLSPTWYSFYDGFMLHVAISYGVTTQNNLFHLNNQKDKDLVPLVEKIAGVRMNGLFEYSCKVLNDCMIQEFKYGKPLCFECSWRHNLVRYA